MNNTEFSYLYRDGSSGTKTSRVIFKPGAICCKNASDRLAAAFDNGKDFVAGQVGVPDLRPASRSSAETGISAHYHSRHQFSWLTESVEPATDGRTLDQFVFDVEKAARSGWRECAPHPREEALAA